MEKFSAAHREKTIKYAKTHTFDAIIIGGGITGAGILLDAVSRGLDVLLIEKHDFASGTSGKSTKLIHGGLRYLKQFDISLVREVGHERAILHKNARHLVRPRKMLLPIFEGGPMGRTTSSIALWIYDWLADVQPHEKRKMLDNNESLQEEPMLNIEGLKGSGLYWEYITDDTRLTIEIIKRAHILGANAINYFTCEGFLYDEKHISGIKARDEIKGELFELKSRAVINAAGPWVDELRKLDKTKKFKKGLQLTKGVHIVIDRNRIPINQACYFIDGQNKRMIFAIPRFNRVYIGTTETLHPRPDLKLQVSEKEADYLLASCNRMFPSIHLELDDVISSWAGLRPLIFLEGKEAVELSRKDEIFSSENGLISIAGGKLTSYRKMAERAVDILCKQLQKNRYLNKSIKSCCTEEIRIYGAIFNSEQELMKFKENCLNQLFELGIKPSYGQELLFKYGAAAKRIIDLAKQYIENGKDSEEAIILSELQDCLEEEMVIKPADFIIRRSAMIYFHPEKARQYEEIILEHMRLYYNWTDSETMIARNDYTESLASIRLTKDPDFQQI